MYTKEFIENNRSAKAEYIAFVADCLEEFLKEKGRVEEYVEAISKWSNQVYSKNESDLIFLDVKCDIDRFGIEWELIADGFETEEMTEEFISFMKSKNNDRFDLDSIYG